MVHKAYDQLGVAVIAVEMYSKSTLLWTNGCPRLACVLLSDVSHARLIKHACRCELFPPFVVTGLQKERVSLNPRSLVIPSVADMRVCVYVIAGDKAKADELVGLFPSTYMSDA